MTTDPLNLPGRIIGLDHRRVNGQWLLCASTAGDENTPAVVGILIYDHGLGVVGVLEAPGLGDPMTQDEFNQAAALQHDQAISTELPPRQGDDTAPPPPGFGTPGQAGPLVPGGGSGTITTQTVPERRS